GTVEDFIVLWSVLKRRSAWPDTALFVIDNWAFNRMHPQVRWLEWADDVNRFVDAGRAPFGLTLGPALYRWYQVKDLFSYTVFKTSLGELRRRRERGIELVESLGRDLVPESAVVGRRALRADGSFTYDRDYVEQTVAQVRGEATRYAATDKGNLTNFQW